MVHKKWYREFVFINLNTNLLYHFLCNTLYSINHNLLGVWFFSIFNSNYSYMESKINGKLLLVEYKVVHKNGIEDLYSLIWIQISCTIFCIPLNVPPIITCYVHKFFSIFNFMKKNSWLSHYSSLKISNLRH